LHVCIAFISDSGYNLFVRRGGNAMNNKINLSPSVMCADLVNLESDISELKHIGMDRIHVDIIDGQFSPSMPLGLETVKRIRAVTDLKFDVHLMSMNNEFFISEILKIGAESITFHYETSLHIDRYISLIKSAGAKAGIALNPATPVSSLECIIDKLDLVCLMLINPGFAGNKTEKQIDYAAKKIIQLKALIEKTGSNAEIQVDGRVSLDSIPKLVSAGAQNLVLGSTSLFIKENSLIENKELVLQAVKKGMGDK
jgi:ribulose-phosphate 3-epimerase